LRAIAYHEAGHAVAARLLLCRYKYVTIKAGEGSLGHVLMHRIRITDEQAYDLSPTVRDRFERDILVSLAGPEAERLVSKRYNHAGAFNDYRAVVRLS
jgi:hypothetical protein